MDVSIIIVNFNTKKLVEDCIKSIKKNTKKVSYEVIVVDNASSERIDLKDTKIIRNETNLGFARANNQGIEASNGKYILLLNSDTVVKLGAIDKLFEFAEEMDAGVVVPKLLNTDGSIQPSCFRLPSVGLAIRQYFLRQKGLLDKYAPQEKEAAAVDSAVMAAFLITPLGLEKVGKLNEKYFMYFEDLDYCRKIKEAGLKIYYLPSAEVVHIHGGSGGKNDYLIASAKKYHGFVGYYIYTLVLWLGQKWEKFLKIQN